VQTGDVRNAHVYLRDFSQTLNSEGVAVSRVFPRGTMLFTIAANIGDLAFLSFDAACPDSLVAVEPKQGIDERWLFYQLTAFKADFEGAATQNAQLNINLEKLNPFQIPVPPLAEQQAIAAALSDADGVVAGLERVIAKKRLIKQGAMQDLLTARRRLPGFSGEWVPRPLSSVSSFITKGATPTTYGFGWEAHGILFLRSECVSSRGLDLSQSMFISEEAHRATKRSEVTGGDILITITGNVGRVIRLPNDFGQANINQHIARIRINSGAAIPDFVFHQLSRPEYLRHFNSIVTGQAYPQISLQQVREAEVHFPEIEEQLAIAEFLSDMDAEIQTLESRLTKARAVKEGMMQNLLTGRVRLV
jgi:type I restriction enzyme S subunit